MKGNASVVAILQRAVSGEAQAQAQYIADAEWLERIGLSEFADFIRKRAEEEKEHLTLFSRRLVFLEADPAIAPKTTEASKDVTAMLTTELRQEMEAVALYTDACEVCFAAKDFVSFDIFREVLADEQEHVRYIEGGLYLISRMDEPNFIQAYVKLPEGK